MLLYCCCTAVDCCCTAGVGGSSCPAPTDPGSPFSPCTPTPAPPPAAATLFRAPRSRRPPWTCCCCPRMPAKCGPSWWQPVPSPSGESPTSRHAACLPNGDWPLQPPRHIMPAGVPHPCHHWPASSSTPRPTLPRPPSLAATCCLRSSALMTPRRHWPSPTTQRQPSRTRGRRSRR